jgi:hypothetical protein
MAVDEHESGTKTLDGSEQTLNTTSPETSNGVIQIWIDAAAMAKDDVVEIRLKEKVISGGTQRLVEKWVIANDQGKDGWVSPSFILLHGWDVTAKRTAGSITSLPWSLRKVS